MPKILVVEDDITLRNLYHKVLKDHGYEVIIATNGQEGLDSALSQKPDLILLDIRLPIMDGATMMRKLREDPWGQNVPVIVLTAVEPNQDSLFKEITVGRPAHYFLKTDAKPDEVLAKIDELINFFKD